MPDNASVGVHVCFGFVTFSFVTVSSLRSWHFVSLYIGGIFRIFLCAEILFGTLFAPFIDQLQWSSIFKVLNKMNICLLQIKLSERMKLDIQVSIIHVLFQISREFS